MHMPGQHTFLAQIRQSTTVTFRHFFKVTVEGKKDKVSRAMATRSSQFTAHWS